MHLEKYFIAILPPESIRQEVLQIKEYVRDQFRSKGALNSPAHITLHMPFSWRPDRESELADRLARFSATQHPFSIGLNGFGCFSPRVLFIHVNTSPSLDGCQRELVRFCRAELGLLNSLYKDQAFHPHVTVGFRDLRKAEFHGAWDEFRERAYHAEFVCSSIELLKHDGKIWHPFKTFTFRER